MDGQANGNKPLPDPGKKTFDTTFIADGFTAAVVAHPKRLLAADALTGLPLDEWFGPLAKLGLDPRRAEEVLLLFAPNPGENVAFSLGGVVRFGEPVDGQKLLLTAFPAAKEATFQDKVYYTLGPPIAGVPWAVHVANDRTAVAAPEPLLKKMLSAKGATSPLIDQLRKADPDDDLTAVVAVEPMRPLVSGAIRQFFGHAPPELAAGAALGDQMNAVTLTVNLTKDPLFAVDGEAKDEKTAGDVLAFVNTFRDQLQVHYIELRSPPGLPPDAGNLIDRFSGDLQKAFVARSEGSHVRLSVKRPAATKDLITALGPMGPRLLAAAPAPSIKPPREPRPAAPPGDAREQGVAWVRDNNAFGPDHKIVADARTRLTGQVREREGFLASLGPKLLKSQKPTYLVGWGGEVFALELSPEQAQQAGVAEAAMVVQTVPPAADLGREDPLCQLSDLKIDGADALDPAAPIKGTVTCRRLRDDNDDYYALRLSVLSRSRVTLFDHLQVAELPKQGPLAFSFPAPNQAGVAQTGPLAALVEVVGFRDSQGETLPIVLSAPTAVLLTVQTQKFGDQPSLDPDKAAALLRQQRYALQVDDGQPDRPIVGASLSSGVLTPDAVQALASIKGLRTLSFYETVLPEGSLQALRTVQGLQELDLSNGQVEEAVLKEVKGLKGLHRLSIDHKQLTDAVVGELKALSDLEDLSLGDGPVTDAGLRELKDLPRLRRLKLRAVQVTPASLKELHGLQVLTLMWTPFAEAGLADLQELKDLQTLHLRGEFALKEAGLRNLGRILSLHNLGVDARGGMTDGGWEALAGLAELQTLSVHGEGFTGAGLKAFRGLKGLQTVRVSRVTDEGLEAVAGLETVRTLSVSGEKFTDEGLKSLGRLAHLESLDIAAGPGVTGAGLQALRPNKGLRKLTLYGPGIGDDAMNDVKALAGLRYLSLSGTAVTDAGLKQLQEVKELEHLTCMGNKTTGVGLADLKKALPKLEVQIFITAPDDF